MIKIFGKFFNEDVKPFWKILEHAFILLTAFIFLNFFHFKFWFIALYLLLVLIIYFKEDLRRVNYRTHFFAIILLFILLLQNNFLENFLILKILFFLLYFLLIFFTLGLINLVFKDNFFVFNLLNFFTLFLFFYFIFSKDYFLLWNNALWLIFIFFVLFFIFLEFWKNTGGVFYQKEKFWSLLLALFGVELSVSLTMLPLELWNAAIFLTLVMILLRDTYLAYEKGILNHNFIFKQITILIVFIAIIFLSVNWKVG